MTIAMESDDKAPGIELKVENLTKWMESIQEDSDESGVDYFYREGTELIDDRDIAQCAIAITKANSKKGFVSLCTYIARILKQNIKLRRKLRYARSRLIDTKSEESPSQNNKSKSYSKSASRSRRKILETSLPLKDKNSRNGKFNLKTADPDLDDGRDRVKTFTAVSVKPANVGKVILTEAIVHHSPQPSTSTYQTKELSPFHELAQSQESIVSKSDIFDDNSPQENVRLRSPLSKSSNTSPERIFASGRNDLNKLRSPSASLGSPKLTDIHEDVPLDVFCCNDKLAESIPEASEETNYMCTSKDTSERCKCAQHWIDKYENLNQQLMKMKNDVDMLQELINREKSDRRSRKLSAKKTNDTEELKETKSLSASTNSEAQIGDSASSNVEPDWLNRLMQQNLTPLMAPTPLKGCKCKNCNLAIQEELIKNEAEDHIEVFELVHKGKPLLEVSANVMIPGNTIARVMYIGHLDSTDMPAAVFVGVTVATPIGNSNGRNAGKQYFKCPSKHGIFMPINQILFVVSPATKSESYTVQKAPLRKQRSHSHPGGGIFTPC